MTWESYVFDRYLRRRRSMFPGDLSRVSVPSIPGLVSVIIPAYNGVDYLHEAVESILTQQYQNWEIVAVDDGSTDRTGELLDEYAASDARIHVIHQENKKVPAALNTGFAVARGEFLTWTSCDNRSYPDCLQKLVDELQRHPDWDMVYANLDLIDENGLPFRNSSHYRGYQEPRGSEHVFLPADPSELNIRANDYIGAAVLYRSRVRVLAGDYDTQRFTVDDYDYWMRVNEFFNLRHTTFQEPIYAYRFHSGALTARRDALKIPVHRNKLMIFDDFRRDANLAPRMWCIDISSASPADKALGEQFHRLIHSAGHRLIDLDQARSWTLPRFFPDLVYVNFCGGPSTAIHPPRDLPENCLKVLVTSAAVPEETSSEWDLLVYFGNPPQEFRTNIYPGSVISVPDLATLWNALDIKTRSRAFDRYEQELFRPPSVQSYAASVVVCAQRASDCLTRCVTSVLDQQISKGDFELIVVNNAPGNEGLERMLTEIRSSLSSECNRRFTIVHCPIEGQSQARNAGISRARGDVIAFIDPDAIPQPRWLQSILTAFQAHPETGVIGGPILLDETEPTPRWLRPAWKHMLGHFDPGFTTYTTVQRWRDYPGSANWSARRSVLLEMGGFRTRYDRQRNASLDGQAKIAACLAQRLDCMVGIEPGAAVIKHIAPARFNITHLWKSAENTHRMEYAAQRDLYVPVELGPKFIFQRVLRAFRTFRPGKVLNTLATEVRGFVWYFSDLVRRIR